MLYAVDFLANFHFLMLKIFKYTFLSQILNQNSVFNKGSKSYESSAGKSKCKIP